MPELPSGTVTFLFTDIEGSTGLLHELGDKYAGALAEHRRILRAALSAHDGVEGTPRDRARSTKRSGRMRTSVRSP
jgi:class 3 adenylate cyclase